MDDNLKKSIDRWMDAALWVCVRLFGVMMAAAALVHWGRDLVRWALS